jgi:asparagine synthase (glutamine-hydrolysing)
VTACFGIVSLHGTAVPPDCIAAMSRALAQPDTHAAGTFCSGPFAAGARLSQTASGCISDPQPLERGRHVMVARARLDNADELRQLLNLDKREDIADSRLILAAYERWGESCVDKLAGDWVFALWDKGRNTLLIARDATGNTGLYWTVLDNRLIFSTGIKGILSYPGMPLRPNALAIAGLLTVFGAPAEQGATAYERIERLLPGHMLAASEGRIFNTRWWKPEELSVMNVTDPQEHYNAFLDLYSDAVAKRLRVPEGTIATTLSGGLDSASVAALAGAHLRKIGQRLTAFVHRPLYEPPALSAYHSGDEFEYARKTAEHVGNVDLISMRSPDVSVLEGIRASIEIHDSPAHAAANQYWILDIVRAARARGSRVLLTGQGGNATISYYGSGNLLLHLLDGRIRLAWTALKHDKSGLRKALRRRVAKPIVQKLRENWISYAPARNQSPWSGYSAISLALAQEMNLLERMRASGHDPAFGVRAADSDVVRRFRLGLAHGGASGTKWMETSNACGIDIRDPTLDRRLVEFCWRTPDEIFWAQGLQRGLLRESMRELLPADVLLSPVRGVQSADLAARLHAQREEIDAILCNLEQHPLCQSWLNMPLMRRMFEGVAVVHSQGQARPQATAFTRALSVAVFLTRF